MTKRYFTEDHQWLDISDDMALLGITRLGEEMLGDLVFIESLDIGTRITQGNRLLTLESVKTAYDLTAPLSGTVTEFNTQLSTHPELINTDPDATWIVKIQVPDKNTLLTEWNSLLTIENYEKIPFSSA